MVTLHDRNRVSGYRPACTLTHHWLLGQTVTITLDGVQYGFTDGTCLNCGRSRTFQCETPHDKPGDFVLEAK